MSEKMLKPSAKPEFGFVLAKDFELDADVDAMDFQSESDEAESDTRVDDIEKAEYMAYAAKRFEDAAASYRQLGKEAILAIGDEPESGRDFSFATYDGYYNALDAQDYAYQALENAEKADAVYEQVGALYDMLHASIR